MEPTVSYLTFDEVGITVAVIAAALAFIVLAWNAVKAIHDWRQMARKPADDRMADHDERLEDHEKRIGHLEDCCEEVQGKLKADWEWQRASVEMDKLILRAINQLLEHSVSGDDVDGLKEMASEINAYLIEHQQR